MTKKQLLMCVESVECFDVVIAKKGSIYTLRDTVKCDCGKTFVSVEEVIHPLDMECVEGEDLMPGKHFVPLNDPDLKDVEEENEDELKNPQVPATIH